MSITAARGVDPYASRPSIEQLLAAGPRTVYSVEAIGMSLQAQLRDDVDPGALVVSDVAAEASGLASVLGDPRPRYACTGRGGTVLKRISTPLSDRVNDIAAVLRRFS